MPIVSNETICALATAPGRSGVGIVRVSGADSLAIARTVLGFEPRPRHAHYCPFLGRDDEVLDEGIALYFPSPNSFTGEDTLELQAHGGPQVLQAILEYITQLGPRLARPGEFSERAFLNNKIDLLQAEALADLIDAGSRQAARSAMRTLQGEFSRRIDSLVETLIGIRINVEAAIDFSDEDIDVLSDTGVMQRLQQCQQELNAIFYQARQGALLKEGMNVVIAGLPNAGKSSLLNALSGQDTAIVTDIPGTTRDLLRQEISIDGLPMHFIDTAGLRKTEDRVEQEGVRRARQAMSEADRLLLVVDAAQGEKDIEGQLRPLLLDLLDKDEVLDLLARCTIVHNKIDLTRDAEPAILSTTYQQHTLTLIRLSAKNSLGIDLLSSHLQQCVGFDRTEESVFVARERHLQALRAADALLQKALTKIEKPDQASEQLELVAEDLRLAQRELGQITGQVSSDDLLGKIFASFCVGK